MSTPAERCIAQAIHQEAVQGYVRFADIYRAEGFSRQRADACFEQAVKNKLITGEQLEEWKQSYKLRTKPVEMRLHLDNEAWLKSEAERLELSWHDLLNRVLQQHIHTTKKNHATSSQSPIP